MLIRVFKSAMDREMALKKLSPNGLSGLLRRCISGQMLGAGEVFIPYRLYKIKIHNRDAVTVRFLSVDSVLGTLDPIEFASDARPLEYSWSETRNTLPQKISEIETRSIVLAKAQRIIFSVTPFRPRNYSVEPEVAGPDFFLSYWLGFYGDKKNVEIAVLNPITHSFEGSRMTACVKEWLHQKDTLSFA